MSKSTRNIVFRIVTGVVLLILVGVVGFSVWVSNHYRKIIIEHLPGWVAKSTDSVYNISVSDISINIFTRQVTINNIKLWPDTNQVNRLKQRGDTISVIFNVSIPRVRVRGIGWENLVSEQQIDCQRVTISDPIIHVFARAPSKDSLSVQKKDTAKGTFIQEYYAARVEILHPKFTYHFSGLADSFYCTVNDGNILLNEWRMNRNQPQDTVGFFHAKNAVIELDSCLYHKIGHNYQVAATSVNFITNQHSLSLTGFSLTPVLSKEAFYKKMGVQKEMYNLMFPAVRFVNIDWRKFEQQKIIIADSLNLDTPSLDIYFTRLMPPNEQSKLGNYPSQLLHKLKIKADIKNVAITEGHLRYTEINEKTKEAGILLFDDVHGSISNVTNMDSVIMLQKNCIINLSGLFMQNSPISAVFNFPLNDTTGAFSVDCNLEDLDASQITDQARALALASVRSFHLVKMTMHLSGNQSSTQGHFTMLYNNLNIQLQRVDSNAHLHRRGFLSFLANNVFLYPDNPMPNQDVRSADTHVPRDPLKSYFNQIWKNIYLGAQETALRDQKILEVMKNAKATREKRKSLLKILFGRKKKRKR